MKKINKKNNLIIITKCKVYDLESLTGIPPRDSWWSKARNNNVYYDEKLKKGKIKNEKTKKNTYEEYKSKYLY